MGGEGEGCRAVTGRGRHFKRSLADPFAISRGWRRDGSSGETGRGEGFSSHFGRHSLPLGYRHPFEILCLASSHTGEEQGLQNLPLWTQRHFGQAVGTSPAQLLPHSASRAHWWEKLVMQ